MNIDVMEAETLVEGIDIDVTNTVVNDGVLFADGIIFGTKDLEFSEKKAGLYLWRFSDSKLIRLRDDQICSNGKVIIEYEDSVALYDIDSPSKTVVKYDLDVEKGTLSDPEVVLDFTSGEVFPDGMISTPDGESLIIAFYNPNDAESGEAKQFSIETGECEATWLVPNAPQVTCPNLIKRNGKVELLLTTAVEHMAADRLETHSNSGALFVGETEFTELNDQPKLNLG